MRRIYDDMIMNDSETMSIFTADLEPAELWRSQASTIRSDITSDPQQRACVRVWGRACGSRSLKLRQLLIWTGYTKSHPC